MNTTAEQSISQLLRLYTQASDEKVKEKLNDLADLLEKYGIQSINELESKLQTSQKELTSEEKEKLIQEIRQIYEEADGSFTREQIQKILDLGNAERFKNKKELQEFIQNFEPNIEGRTKKDLTKAWEVRLRNVSKHSTNQVDASDIENNPRNDGTIVETVTNDSSQTSQTQEINPPSTDNSLQDKTATVIENYVRQAIQLRDEKSYELTDENISKIVELAKEIKRFYKIEGLKSFMNSLGINTIGVKNGELINKIVYHFESVALMRFKAVRMQMMK